MNKLLIGALAGILALGVNCSKRPVLNQKNYSIETSQKSLDSIIKIYNTPKSIQEFVSGYIKAVEAAERFYPEINKNSAPEGFIRFPSPENILKKKYGDCEEGFILTAAALKKLGYKTKGITISDSPQGGGHTFTVYQDPATKLYGSTGINISDYCPPTYKSVEGIAIRAAIDLEYDVFSVKEINVTEDIFNNLNYIELPEQHFKDINLGVKTEKKRLKFGELEREIGIASCKSFFRGTLQPKIKPKELTEIIDGPVEYASILHFPREETELFLIYRNNFSKDYSVEFKLDKQKEEINRIIITSLSNERYRDYENVNGLFRDNSSKKSLSKKELQEYTALVNYFLILMENKETKYFWEQNKKINSIP